jgi:anti-sigma factor (TIGR02949 family)
MERTAADIDCEQAQEEFSALLDGELNAEDQDRVESHLAQCSTCLRELSSVQHVQQLYRSQPLVTAPEKLRTIPIATKSKPTVKLSNSLHNHSTRSYRSLMTAGGMLLIVAMIWLVMSSIYVPMDEPVLEKPTPLEQSFSVELTTPSEVPAAGVADGKPGETLETQAETTAPAAQFTPINFIGDPLGKHWTQKGYAGESTTPMERDNEIFKALMLNDPNLAKIESAAESVIFQFEGAWYKVDQTPVPN